MTEDHLATIGVFGLISWLIVSHLTSKVKGSIDVFAIFILLFGVWPVAGPGLHDILFNGTWATQTWRIFVCAAVALTPGVLALRLIIRALPALFAEDTDAKA